MSGKCIILCAPSGAGKTSITKYLLGKDLDLEFSISACNRERRSNETDGIDYHFLSTDDFKAKIANNEFVEWEEVYEMMYYGTLKSEIERIWQSGKNVIFDVDVKGGLSLTKYFGDKALAIFIKPPSLQELENRLRNRGTESEDTVRRRISKATHEMSFANSFDKVILNNKLEEAQQEAYSIIKTFINS